MSTFVFNDPKYLSDMSERERRELRMFVGGPLADELPERGTTMTTKNAAQTTTTKKETTMPAITMPEKKYPSLAERIALHNEWSAIIQAANVEPEFDEVVNPCPGKDVSNLTSDPIEQAFLPYVCAYFGWGNELCTENQAKDSGGTLKAGAQGWPALWATTTTKSGPNAGKTSTFCQFVYPVSAFDWKTGAPEVDDDAIANKELDALIRAANRAIAKARAKAKEMGVKLDGKRLSRVEPKPAAATSAAPATITAADIDPALLAAIIAAVNNAA